MSVRNALLGLAVAVATFILVTVVVTELAARAIEFSLLLGLPAGLAVGLLSGILAYAWLGGEDSDSRRRGAALATFGIVLLTVLIALVAVAGFRNSQALPIAALTSVIAGGVAYLWYRRGDREVTPIESS